MGVAQCVGVVEELPVDMGVVEEVLVGVVGADMEDITQVGMGGTVMDPIKVVTTTMTIMTIVDMEVVHMVAVAMVTVAMVAGDTAVGVLITHGTQRITMVVTATVLQEAQEDINHIEMYTRFVMLLDLSIYGCANLCQQLKR